MQVLMGTYLGESTRDFSWTDKSTGEVKTGTERNLHVLDDLYTRVVTRQRDFADDTLPATGEQIALEVWGKGIGRQVAYMAVRVLEVAPDDFTAAVAATESIRSAG